MISVDKTILKYLHYSKSDRAIIVFRWEGRRGGQEWAPDSQSYCKYTQNMVVCKISNTFYYKCTNITYTLLL